ncbi:MAG: helix-turn-helix domain-containing protein [Candidatus Omnitrophica bacterium]|nr:helix-turn-helix domain-containing protein [Candidatus Omnitrophota bacterium]
MAYTIFLIDDDKEFCEEFSDCFHEYNVVKAFTAGEALEILGSPNEIDLIVLDQKLPNNKKGSAIIGRIKELKPGAPVVMLTGFSSKKTAIKALRAHADEYIEKPMDIEKTKTLVNRLLVSSGKKKTREGSGLSGKIERVSRFIEKNFDKIVTLEDAAKRVGLSPKYLSRVYKEETGANFNEYYLSCKLKKADEMLTDTGYTIEQIADRLGYRNPESFIRIYKKHRGCTPSKIRTENPKKAKSKARR